MFCLQCRGVSRVAAQADNVVVIGKKSIPDYVLEIILKFNEGIDEVVIKGRGQMISKAVDVYNALKSKLGDSLQLVSVNIDSDQRGNRLVSYIEIRVRRTI